MAELLVKAADNQLYRRGYVMAIKESPATWGSAERLPNFVRIKVEDATVADLSYLKSEDVQHNFNVYQVEEKIRIEPASVTISNQNTMSSEEQQDIAYQLNSMLNVTDIGLSTSTRIEFDAEAIQVSAIEAMLADFFTRTYSLRRFYIDQTEIDKLVLAERDEVNWSKDTLLGLIKDRMLD